MKKITKLTLGFSALVLAFSCNELDDFIGDGGKDTPVDVSTLTYKKIGTFSNGNGSGEEGFAEISAFDAKTNKLFIVNPEEQEISVWDITNPAVAVKGSSIALTGTPNSVAVKDGVLAVALENENKQANGTIVTYSTDSQNIKNTYSAGALPDMVTFSPDGKYIISANEGEPNDDYTVDPEGSITIVDLAKNETKTIGFEAFDVNAIGNDFRVFGPGATCSQDIEPEYIAVSEDSKYAYVALQENNGMAIVDLKAGVVSELVGLGVKDYSLAQNAIDASNKDDILGNFKTWPVLSYYMPDAITYATINNTGYLITANEGDARDYDGYSEEERVKDLILNTTAFPNAEELQKDENLGRLKTTTANGDIDNDGDFDVIYGYGARSFSIWNTSGALVYDSGNRIGKKTFELNPSQFNLEDSRSDDKGAEPEAVTTLKVGESTLLFVGLERTGGAMVYDISNPLAPVFLKWLFDADDVAPEGLIAIPAKESPTGENLVVITNEVSNTVAIYEIK